MACASVGDPPGGPPDQEPPVVVRITPDSGATVGDPPGEVEVLLSEVVTERVAAPRPDIATAVLLSPVRGPVQVRWRRDRITVRPREGLRPGRVYRLEVFPVITDLRRNRMRQGRLAVFSTGPAIPTASFEGAVVDWTMGRPAVGALIEAVLLPDSLPYRAVADSTGSFTMRQVPTGEYLVYGIVDQDNNRERGPREAFDTVRVQLADSATLEFFAFAHDTTGPRLRTVELADSLTLRLTFDRPLDLTLVLDTAAVRVSPAADSTTRLAVAAVLTPAQYDSLRAVRRAPAASDSARPRTPGDSARAAPPTDSAPPRPPADSLRAPPPADSARPAPEPRPPLPAAAGRQGPAVAQRDSTRAQKMLARRPSPPAIRLLRLAEPLTAGARYQVEVTGVRSLAGVVGDARAQIAVPAPPRRAQPPRAQPGDTAAARADSAPAERPAAAARDTTRPPPPPPLRSPRPR